jgi:spore coat protein I
VFFVYYQVEQVLEKQEPQIENFYKGRGILICESKQGLFALKEYQGSAQKAELLYWLGAYLECHNIRCDSMVKNKEGNLMTEGVDGTVYTMHHWMRGRECDVKNKTDILQAVSFLAKFHRSCTKEALRRAGQQFDEMPGQNLNLADLCARHDRELRRIRKFILKQHNKSDFERLYLSCFPEFIRQSEEVTGSLLEHPENEAGCQIGICHGDLNQHNILFTAAGPAMIHLERFRMGVQMSDLSNFMRKILEKYDWEEQLGMDILKEYNRVHEFRENDLRELYYRLAYPEKFWKIANHYYNSSKVWDSGKNREKLAREIKQNVSRVRFLKKFSEML